VSSHGDPLPKEIVLDSSEARTVYLAVVAALDVLKGGEARTLCEEAQRILVVKYLPDLPELGAEDG
jgi:hypothetical protein